MKSHSAQCEGQASMNLLKMAIGAIRWFCIAGLAVGLSEVPLMAQDKSTSPTAETLQDDSPPTLHVYRSLLQVPVLVLQPDGDLIKKPISDLGFSVSLDSGPWFPATHARREGDDPIALSILLDMNGDGRLLMPKMAEAIARLAPDSLRSQDHVSVYALGCSLISGTSDFPAESAALKQVVDGVLSSLKERNGKTVGDGSCAQKEDLGSALAKVTEGLRRSPGRRVILVVSNGNDSFAQTRSQVIEGAQGASVAIFGLKYSPDSTTTLTENPLQSRGEYGISPDTAPPVELGKDNPFRNLCELTGGTAKLTSPRKLKARLKEFTAMVRGRYVVEFPRPSNGTPGWHAITVRIDQGNYLVRSAGIAFPLMNPAVLADPTTVPSDPARSPSLGSPSPRPQ